MNLSFLRYGILQRTPSVGKFAGILLTNVGRKFFEKKNFPKTLQLFHANIFCIYSGCAEHGKNSPTFAEFRVEVSLFSHAFVTG